MRPRLQRSAVHILLAESTSNLQNTYRVFRDRLREQHWPTTEHISEGYLSISNNRAERMKQEYIADDNIL